MLISFIDILYGIAIGTGLAMFPKNPLDDIPSSILFLLTLLIAGHDWYEYHSNETSTKENQKFTYFFIQIFIVLMLNQMFVHSTNTNINAWLWYFVIFMVLNTAWNLLFEFENHYWYALNSFIIAIIISITTLTSIQNWIATFSNAQLVLGIGLCSIYFSMIYSVDYVVLKFKGLVLKR